MKKIATILITISFTFLCFISNTHAYEEQIIYQCIEETFDDGSYIETIIKHDVPLIRASSVSGTKTKNYKDKSGKIIWYVKVNGKFSYNGKTATCTTSNVEAKSSNYNWKIASKKATRYGATATASCTAKKYSALGIQLSSVNTSVSLTCSGTGKLS